MPRFNFASDPKDESGDEKRKPVEPVTATPHEAPQDAGAHATAEERKPGAPKPDAPTRSIPLEDVIPKAYREARHDKFTAPPKTSSTPPSPVAEAETPIPQSQRPASAPDEPAADISAAETPTQPKESVAPEVAAPQAAASERTHATREEAPSTAEGFTRKDPDEDFDNPFANLEHDEYLTAVEDLPPSGAPEQKRSILPLIGIACVVLFLIAISVVWFFNPYPPLRETMAAFFYGPAPSQLQSEPEDGDALSSGDGVSLADSLKRQADATRDWNYYLQIAAFPELYKAQDDANRLRKLGLNAKVEGEFIPAQRRTYYRVRLGPFPSAYAAAMKGDSLKDVIPASAFIDSIRVETDMADTASGEPPMMQPVLRKPPRTTTASSSVPPGSTPQRRAEAGKPPAQSVPEAAAGFAVHVASFNALSTAQDESRGLIGRGLPAYTSKSVQGGTAWYRVLVGPFRTRTEAERYLEIVKKEAGSSAYVRQLGN